MDQCQNTINQILPPLPSEDLVDPRQPKNKKRPLAATDFSEGDRKRFWKFVTIKSPDECWPWNGARNKTGYGQFWLNRAQFFATRASYALKNGEMPSHLNACHKCDNPACVNPGHIFPGTYKENTQDMLRKKRNDGGWRHGERNAMAKLTATEVKQIREEYNDKRGMFVALARKYKVSEAAVRKIIHGERWVMI